MTTPSSPRDGHTDDQYLTVSKMSGMGLELVGAIGTMAVIGWLLDKWLGTDPWLIVTGLGVGLIAGMVRFFRTALSVTRQGRSKPDDSAPPDA
jgi:F0F1-type ATP synthase assembly protein I